MQASAYIRKSLYIAGFIQSYGAVNVYFIHSTEQYTISYFLFFSPVIKKRNKKKQSYSLIYNIKK